MDNNNLPTISVIVPVYNAANIIDKLIKSLLNLDYPKNLLEIIIVDNNSTDDTKKIIEKYSQIKLLEENSKQSSYAARNKGIEQAKGEILAFTDADCVVDPAWLKQGVQAMNEADADLVGGKVQFVFSKGKTASEMYDCLVHINNKKSISQKQAAATANLIVKAELFKTVGLFAELKSSGDWRWSQQAVKKGYKLIYAKKAIVHHPARKLKELLKKTYRIVRYSGQQNLSTDNSFSFRLLLPGNFSYIKKLIREYGTKDMMQKFLRIWLVSYLTSLTFFWALVNSRDKIKQASINTSWLFSEKILRMVISLLVGIWVARYLGPAEYGLLSYALALIGIFQIFTGLGLPGLVVKTIVKQPDKTNKILGTTFGLRFISAFLSFTAVMLLVYYIRPEDVITQGLVAIIGLGMIVQPLDSVDFWFQAKVKAKYTVYAKTIALFLASLFKIIFILIQAPLLYFGVAALVEVVIISLGLIIGYIYNRQSITSWRFDLALAKSLLKQSWPLILSGFGAIIYLKIDQIMLQQMVGEKELGIYSVAVKISELWYFIPIAIAASVFPALVRLRQEDKPRYQKRLQQLYDGMIALSLPLAIFFTFTADFFIVLLFGDDYKEAGTILSVHIWASLFIFMGAILSKWLNNENLLKFSFWRHSFGAVINVGLNYLLISKYQAMGAAIATVISYASANFFICFMYSKTIKAGKMMLKALFIPVRVFMLYYKHEKQ